MSAKRVGGAVVAILVAAVVWFVWVRDKAPDAPPPQTPANRVQQVDVVVPPAGGSAEARAPRGFAPRFELDVDPEGPLELDGQVVGSDGKGVGDATVWIDTVPARHVQTDASGNFAVDKLVGRSYELTASQGDLLGGPVAYKLTGASDPVVIRLGEGVSVTVHVRDESGKPIAKADVSSGAGGGAEATETREGGDGSDAVTTSRHAVTGEDGTATLKPLRPGWVAVEAKAAGYAPAGNFTSLGSIGAHGDVSIVLRKGVAVSGRVLDDKGKPLAKVHVVARGTGIFGGEGRADFEVTDAHGEFTLPAVASGTHAILATDAVHEPTTGKPFTIADKPIRDLEIRMRAGGVVAGTVVDSGGNPVAFASVRIADAGPGRGGGGPGAGAARQATTDKQGAFEVTGLPRAKVKLRAESEAHASHILPIDLTTEPESRDLKLVLDVGGMISGVVVDDAGQPVPEVSVHAFPDLFGGASPDSMMLAGLSSTTTDGAGAFTVHGLPDGSYKLWAQRGGSSEREWGQHGAAAKVGDKNVRIVLPGNGRLVGKVKIDGQDGPPTFASIDVGSRTSTPLVDGAFDLKELPAGMYDVKLRGADFASFTQRDVQIKANATTDLGTLLVSRGRTLTGTVVDSAGAPVAGAKVRLGDMLLSAAEADPNIDFDDFGGAKIAITDASGAFKLVGLSQRQSNVIADHPDKGRSLAQPVPVSDGDPPPVRLQLRGYGSIAGIVTSQGKPVPGVAVTDTTAGSIGQATIAQTAADGTFTLTKVPEGAHILNAIQPAMMSMKSANATATVVAGKQTTVTIDIPVGDVALTVAIKAVPGNEVDAAQVFLFRGAGVSLPNGKALTDGIFQTALQGIQIWFGTGKPFPVFDQLVPGAYSLCALPVTGNLQDPTFEARMQENMELLKVYCQNVTVAASPAQQQTEADLPAMAPLPGGGSGAGSGSGPVHK